MSRGITWCFDDLDVDEAAHLMEEKKIRRLPIINHDKRMVGILSLDDIALNTPHELSGEVIEAVSRAPLRAKGRAFRRRHAIVAPPFRDRISLER
ncbi:MAG: CBS domain-containing protein [Alphaproteobacteria bacterium]